MGKNESSVGLGVFSFEATRTKGDGMGVKHQNVNDSTRKC
jgi:hypothetical protein